ncbi:DEAD-box ATP-dependent RNA helicase 46 [Pistacia vera]|uniref:DEAD-box ATP-dependent RNA helicase 46 n=1 Tax=Pistacia vera TaxID=55513 RepID=UPI001263BB9C|nr:DEAD-box ATP-dependent RNA helicase 46 [Pistacia vera]
MAATATASSVRYAPEDPSLPKPWKGLVDGRTGYLYFWNPETNVTQYERPTNLAPPPTSSSVPISSSVQVQQSSEGQRRGCSPEKEDDRYGRGTNGVSKLDVGSRGNQNSRGAPVQSHNVPNGTASVGHGGSSMRGCGSSTAAVSLSPDAYRRRHEITVSGDDVPPPFMSFEATGFPSEILREVHNAGFSAPTPIQAQSWPIALQNRDIVAIAKTGSGKTLGYLVPGFIHLKRRHNNPLLGPTVLVLSPTRELATQIQDEAGKFGKSSRIACTCLYGGAPKGPQLKDIDRGVDIVVATPGRLNDILEMRRISLNQVSYLVLDEADRMLDMGFEPQIRKIVKEVPVRRQTLMYTATWPKEVRKIAADLLVNPVQVNIGNVDELAANKAITQYIEVLAPMEKHRRLEHILRSQEPGSKIIIFCSTKKMCDQLARNLTRQFGAAAIHGDKSQSERDYVLNQFRTGRSPVLVATDVAARGLDIKDIRVVVNYDFPTGVEDYVHRIGRTGRAGATGLAYTFFGDQDAKYASDLIKLLEGANQRVPPELREMASRGGGMGRPRRWGTGPGGRDGGRGGRIDSGYGGRDGGRGSWGISSSSSRGGGRGDDHESRDRSRYHDGHDRGRSPSRSPGKGSGWGDRSKNWNCDRSRSRSPPFARGRSPPRSFHQAMMERGRTSPPPHQRVPPYNSDRPRERKSPFHERSPRGANGQAHYGEEEEEGMIHPE